MAVGAAGEAPGQKLGNGFWIAWWAGAILLAALFVVGIWITATRLHSSIAMGALVIGYTLACLGLSMLPWLIRRKRGAEAKMRPPIRRYLLRFLPAMMIYVIVLMAAAKIYAEGGYAAAGSGAWQSWALAIAPCIPLVFAIRAMGLLYKEQDDQFQREQIAFVFVWSTCATLVCCTVWGVLEMFRLAPHIWLWAVLPLWSVFMGVAQGIASWRQR